MRLRLERGLHQHNLQAVLDFEDFVWNRTDGSPANVSKKLGDAARAYVPSPVCDSKRISNLFYSFDKYAFCLEELGIYIQHCRGYAKLRL